MIVYKKDHSTRICMNFWLFAVSKEKYQYHPVSHFFLPFQTEHIVVRYFARNKVHTTYANENRQDQRRSCRFMLCRAVMSWKMTQHSWALKIDKPSNKNLVPNCLRSPPKKLASQFACQLANMSKFLFYFWGFTMGMGRMGDGRGLCQLILLTVDGT